MTPKQRNGKEGNPRQWVSIIPYGINQQHPNAYKDILDTVWENRMDSLGYAYRILRDMAVAMVGALGTSGMHDWTMKGIHLCAVRLQLLRLNTMAPMDWRLLEDVSSLRRMSNRKLRKLGRSSPCRWCGGRVTMVFTAFPGRTRLT